MEKTTQFDPYEQCPVYESKHFLLRLVAMEDAETLLPCYSQPTDSVITNSFNCNFGYGSQTLADMQDFIRRWLISYNNRGFVRWSVVDKYTNIAVGTIELFKRSAKDFFNDCGILRLDLSSDYERTATIKEILSLLLPDVFALFDCAMIATKVASTAKERMMALNVWGFSPTEEQIIRGDGGRFDGFWILVRQI